MKYRFAVGSQNGARSGSWKLWSHGDEVYLADRYMAHKQKFSFHKSGENRWAFIQESTDGSDRAFAKWRRGPTPPAGGGEATLLIGVIFPTNHLSTAVPEKPGQVQWINPAPAGKAIVVEAFLTNDTRTALEIAFAKDGLRTLLAFGTLRNGPNLGVATYYFDCGPTEVRMPREPVIPGQVLGDLVFPDTDPRDPARPVRIVAKVPSDGNFGLWELAGYETNPLAGRGPMLSGS